MTDESAQNAHKAATALASKLAHVQLTEENSLGEVFGSRMFRVDAGWEIDQIKGEPRVAQVISVMQLREAMENTEIETILIPSQNALTMDAAKKVLMQSGQDKTLFWVA